MKIPQFVVAALILILILSPVVQLHSSLSSSIVDSTFALVFTLHVFASGLKNSKFNESFACGMHQISLVSPSRQLVIESAHALGFLHSLVH